MDNKLVRTYSEDEKLDFLHSLLNWDIKIKKLNPEAKIPEYKKDGDAGFDISSIEDCVIPPDKTMLIHTGLAFAIPKGLELQIRLRSGVGLKNTIIIPNSPGTIDSGYRGEVGLIIRNIGIESVKISKGDRIAQGIISPVVHASFQEVDDLPESDRGSGGYGSTGIN